MRFHHFAKRDSIKNIRISVASLCMLLSAVVNISIIQYKNSDEIDLKMVRSADSTLVDKESTGAYKELSGEKELVEERTETFKKFKKIKDGRESYRVVGGMGPIHYKSNPFDESETYKEIDLTVRKNIPNDKDTFNYSVSDNGYQVKIWNKREDKSGEAKYVARFERAGNYLEMAPSELIWENGAGEREVISLPANSEEPEIDNNNYTVTWKNVFGDGIDFRYNISPDKFFKTVIVNDKSDLPEPTISEDDLKLTVVMATRWDEGV